MSQYATVEAWMAYFRNKGLPETPAQRRYAAAYAADGVAPPDAGKSAFEENNAYRIIAEAFEGYGLGTLAPKILELIQAGYNTESEIDLMLRETDEYKKRFAANEARRKKGLTTLSPAEYVSMERQYGQVMRASGLPSGFYDSPDDFRSLLERDVSINEVQQRVQLAQRAAYEAPVEVREQLSRLYGIGPGEITAYFLDPDKGMSLVQKRAAAAEVAAAKARSGFRTDRPGAERLAALGVTGEQAQQGYQQIADLLPDAEKLSDIYSDVGTYDLKAAEAEVFGDKGAADAARTRRGLASRERAAFSGSSGSAGADSLNTRRRGSV